MGLQETANANRLHIGIFGKRNSGKSSLLNAMTNQNAAMVSPVAGTTTDPVYKAMELHGLGPVVWIDTAGFDDEGVIGELRVEKTRKMIEKTDLAILIFSVKDITLELEWYTMLKERNIPVVTLINQKEGMTLAMDIMRLIKINIKEQPLIVNLKEKQSLEYIRESLIRLLPQDDQEESIVGHLVKENDIVLLVMPQDNQAPKGRLILPQVQTIRDLLDHQCIVQSCTADQMSKAIAALVEPPKLIITDSQIFKKVYAKKPQVSLLTSFSILFARYKGDISYFIESAKVIDTLHASSKVLIAEACTHAPLNEDIGRIKIPALLKKKVGASLTIDIVSGTDYPNDVSSYDLIIHCGACMFNRKHVLSRVDKAKQSHVPMTNYGVTIAYINNILDNITI